MAYGRGYAAVKEAIEAKKAASVVTRAAHPADYRVLWNITWKDGEHKLLRLLSDNLILAPIHSFIECKDGKPRDFACTEGLEGDLNRPCWICANVTKKQKNNKTGKTEIVPAKPAKKVLGIAVLRELNEEEEAVDQTREMELLIDPENPDGGTQTVEVPIIGIISQTNTFWDDTVSGYYTKHKTTMDRNYDFWREGSAFNNTKYKAIPEDQDAEYVKYKKPEDRHLVAPIAGPALWEMYGIAWNGKPFIEEDDIINDPVASIAIQWLESKGTPEYFERYLPIKADSKAEPEEEKAEKPAAAPTKFGGLRSKLAKDYPKTEDN